jgi:hypothetical protein
LWKSIDARVRITLDEECNTEFVEALWAALPYRTLQGHALVAGHLLYHTAPVHDFLHAKPDYLVDRRVAPVGTVYCSSLQHLTIKYGDMTEPMPAALVGQVEAEDVAALVEKIGPRVWAAVHGDGAPILAEVRRLGGSGGHRVQREACDSASVRELVEVIAAAAEVALVAPPAELVDLHEGRTRPTTGTSDSVLTTVVFVNGETRPLGYATYTGLAQAARSTDIELGSLVEMAKILVTKPVEFLGYCGLELLYTLTRRVVDTLDKVETRTDFAVLMGQMALYVNALGAWNHQLFPWGLADGSWTYRPTLSPTTATSTTTSTATLTAGDHV